MVCRRSRNGIYGKSGEVLGSVRLDVGLPYHLGPLLSLLGDKFAEAGPRESKDRHAGFSKPRHDIRISESGIDLAMELVNDLKRRTPGSDDATPAACFKPGRVSAIRGMFGSSDERSAAVTPKARNLPALMCGMTGEMPPKATST